jgi:hypothetical protein
VDQVEMMVLLQRVKMVDPVVVQEEIVVLQEDLEMIQLHLCHKEIQVVLEE